jgi:hypothetical protein
MSWSLSWRVPLAAGNETENPGTALPDAGAFTEGLLAAGESRLLTELVDVAVDLAAFYLSTGSCESTVSDSTVLDQRWCGVRFSHSVASPWPMVSSGVSGRVEASEKPARR